MTRPDISVVIGVYNGGADVLPCLMSVLQQRDVDLEVVAVNDGSTDESGSILDEISKEEPRLRVFHQRNAGLTKALIRGCEEARGAFIARQDVDDLSRPGRLRRQLDFLRSRPDVTFVSSWVAYIGPRGELLDEVRFAETPEDATTDLVERRRGPVHGSVMFRKAAYERVGGYRPEFYFAQDADLWMRMIEVGLVAFVPQVLYSFRVSETALSTHFGPAQRRLGELARMMFDLRREQRPEEAALEEARRLRPGLTSAQPADWGAGLYFIARCLIRRGDPRSVSYALRYLRRRPMAPCGYATAAEALGVAVGVLRRGARKRFESEERVRTDDAGRSLRVAPHGPALSNHRGGAGQSRRLLYASIVSRDPLKGASGADIALLTSLREMGFWVDEIWDASSPRRIRHNNLHMILEAPGSLATAMRTRCRQVRYDAVLVNQPVGYRAAAVLKREHLTGAFIARSHGWEVAAYREALRFGYADAGDRPGWRQAASRILRRLASAQCDRLLAAIDGIVVGSRSDADVLVREGGMSSSRVCLMPPGIPTDFLEAPAVGGLGGRERRVLHAAQFTPFKAPEVAAAVMTRVLRSIPDATATWVCESGSHGAVRQLFPDEVQGRLSLLGWMPRDRLRGVYDNHGIYIFPSIYEGYGQTFLEAMSRRCVVLASDVGGMREVIRDGENGFLFERLQSERMAERAISLMSSPDECERLGEAARLSVEGQTWARAAELFAAFLEAVLDRKKQAQARE